MPIFQIVSPPEAVNTPRYVDTYVSEDAFSAIRTVQRNIRSIEFPAGEVDCHSFDRFVQWIWQRSFWSTSVGNLKADDTSRKVVVIPIHVLVTTTKLFATLGTESG